MDTYGKLSKEELKTVAGGGSYDCNWIAKCHRCGALIPFYGFHAYVICQECGKTICLTQGIGQAGF